MDLRSRILEILIHEDEKDDPSQILMEFALDIGWEKILPTFFELLLEMNKIEYWPQIITTFWYAIDKKLTFPADETIAILNNCLERSEAVDGNLVWSITRNLKKVAYDGDYDPYQDDTVWKIMQQLKSK